MGLTKAEREAMRPTNCPFHDTMKICGKAYRSGCRSEPCVEGKQVEKGRKTEARSAQAPSRLVKPKVEIPRQFRANDPGGKNWRLHTTECCRAVWRPMAWGCLPAVAHLDAGQGKCDDDARSTEGVTHD